ncbi:cholesterol transport system auxiliary component [Rhizobiales bacterium GAS191]|jgi:cholesterol transport system auxiliary component|nr:cholesterol transport system auxiliary component [Rhizobiales bacterium GAS188]SED48894.1 cholesterol transport system auxiliary component [Rhizobiales bacterium GAS191]
MSSPPHRWARGLRTRPRSAALLSPALLGLALALAACGGGPPPATFDLAQSGTRGKALHGRHQLSVAEPTALQPLDSDRILVRRSDGSLATLARAQWSDRLPRLLQSRIVQAFENAGAVGRVSAFGGAATADLTLDVEIRVFEVDVGAGQGHIELAATLINAQSGRTTAARILQANAPGVTEGPAAAGSLDQALARLLPELVHWAAPYL